MDPATIAILLGSLAASSAASVYTNQQNIKYAQQANEESIELANTAHQREVRDLQAAGLNPILSARGSGSDVPQLKTPGLENPLEQLGSSAGSLASAFNGLTKAEVDTAQAEASSADAAAKLAHSELLPQQLDAFAREEAMTGVGVSDAWNLVNRYGDPDKYENLVKMYENEIEQGRYLNSREHAIYSDILSGVGSATGVINSAANLRRVGSAINRDNSAIKRDNYEMAKPTQHESVRTTTRYNRKGEATGRTIERRRHN